MSILTDSVGSTTTLIQPSVSSLSNVQTVTSMADSNIYKNAQSQSNALLVDDQVETNEMGSYTSQPRTLKLETASDSSLSASSTSAASKSSSSGNSGSIDAQDNMAVSVNANTTLVKTLILFTIISFFMSTI